MNAAPPLEVRGLSAGYERGAAIVEGVGFTLRAGTMTAVVGPNGAGKSTLLKAALGTTPWRAGEALFFGHALDDVRARVGVIPQRSEIDWSFPISAIDVAAMGTYPKLGILRRIGRTERAAARAALDAVGLGELSHAQVGELSGGQQQRVLVARALAQDASLLILDEPFANIDAASAERIARVLRDCAARGTAILAVQHDLASVRAHFDDAIVLNRTLIAHAPVDAALAAATLARAYGFDFGGARA